MSRAALSAPEASGAGVDEIRALLAARDEAFCKYLDAVDGTPSEYEWDKKHDDADDALMSALRTLAARVERAERHAEFLELTHSTAHEKTNLEVYKILGGEPGESALERAQRVAAALARVTGELAEARAFGEDAARRYNALLEEGKVLRCAFARMREALERMADKVTGKGGHGCICGCPVIDGHTGDCIVVAALAAALHRPAVSVERLRALIDDAAFYSAEGKCSAVPLDSLQALIAEAAQ